MTYNEFMVAVLEVFPEAECGEDNDGQLVIYTGLRERHGQVLPIEGGGARG